MSCSKSFLNESDPTKIGVNRFYNSPAEVSRALNGIYGSIQDLMSIKFFMDELITDNTTVDFNPGDRGPASNQEQFEFWTITPINPTIINTYNICYSAISNINTAINKLSSMKGNPDEIKILDGQLRVLRSYFYFTLTRYFGDVVIVTDPFQIPSDAFQLERSPQSQCYDLIESELKIAINELPVNYPSYDVGRITKGAALSMLGELYVTKKQFTEAISTLQEVTTLGYDLLPSYTNVFDPAQKNSIESIWEVQYQGGNDLGEWSSFIYQFAPRDSKGFVTGFSQSSPGGWGIPTKDLISSYEAGDLRKEASIGLNFISPVTGDVIPYIKKYAHPHTIYGRTDNGWYIYRYAGVLLLLAEAINEGLGPTSEALGYLNEIRNRAGLSSLSGLDQVSFREAVYHERRIELAFENDRWPFLRRTMTPVELVTFLHDYSVKEMAEPTVQRQGIPYSNSDYNINANKLTFPIPSDQVRINHLVQNPGY